MRLRAHELPALERVLSATLRFGRVRSIRQVQDREDSIVFEIRSPGKNHWLEYSTNTAIPYALLRDERRPAPTSPSAFTMLLRKHVDGLALLQIQHHPHTMVVEFVFGLEEPISRLYFDLQPTGPNLYLCDAPNILYGSAHPRRAQPHGLRVHSLFSLDDLRLPSSPHNEEPPLDPRWEAPANAPWTWLHERFDSARDQAQLQELQKSLRRRLQSARKRAQRRVKNVEKDLNRAENIDVLRHEAELLQSARHLIQRGDAFVEVPDWNDAEMRPRRIELDPSLALQPQIDERFRRYRRLKDAETTILERLESVEKQAMATEEAWRAFQELQDVETLQSFTRTLERKRLIHRENHQAQIRTIARQPFTEARSSDGYRILVGRNAKDNDTLTLRIARGRDLWFHARDRAGSHVIIWRDRNDDVPPRTIYEAAVLAAHNSSAANDTRVDVGYTERKHVSKPSGSPPGSVHAASMKTIYVEPDANLCAELYARAQEYRAQNEKSP